MNINESNYNKNYWSRIWIKIQFENEINMKALNKLWSLKVNFIGKDNEKDS